MEYAEKSLATGKAYCNYLFNIIMIYLIFKLNVTSAFVNLHVLTCTYNIYFRSSSHQHSFDGISWISNVSSLACELLLGIIKYFLNITITERTVMQVFSSPILQIFKLQG